MLGNNFDRDEPSRNKEFEVYMLNGAGEANAADIRDCFDYLLNRLSKIIYIHGREFSILKTKLEEACFFAKKALAVRPEMQEQNSDPMTGGEYARQTD